MRTDRTEPTGLSTSRSDWLNEHERTSEAASPRRPKAPARPAAASGSDEEGAGGEFDPAAEQTPRSVDEIA